MSMNISAVNVMGAGTVYQMNGVSKDETPKAEPMTAEEVMMEDFKEQNSPANNRISQLYGKFRAGKELTGEELEYLAKNAPDIYKDVCDVIRERRALEMQMKQAKTKQQVAAVSLNEAAYIKKTKGTGEEEKRHAMKTMARTNQVSSAYSEYTASVEYKEKEDEKTEAKSRRDQLRELVEQQEAVGEAQDIAEEENRSGEMVDSEPEENSPDAGVVSDDDSEIVRMKVRELYKHKEKHEMSRPFGRLDYSI